ncbi:MULTISPECIES: microaggregate-binding protein 1 [Prauserella]|uniref:Uncharacterized protein YjbJ (UPF0337 family) n=3 Tax=Prauserella TaxID=142577 RepID=A0A839XPC3_9PSEU|nr:MULTISPECIES: CsbD family protein [Prauserella]MBB3662698.1 uncharacterized protein YjbJ (UPF0337 family) [Prauserella sediminis]MCP2181867.1 CsbD-like [Prauserella alba]MCR3720399.1 CsbD-like [Prauserella flava]MCR3733892.1 CsbD-like [Prauserella salsuginis]
MNRRDEQQEGLKGAVEDIKGRVKQAAGSLLGHDSMQQEGSAQQDKAEAQREVAEKEAQAKEAERKATESQARERSQQE